MKIKSVRVGLVILGVSMMLSGRLGAQTATSIRTNSVVRGMIDDPLLSRPVVLPVISSVPRPQPSVRAVDIRRIQQFNQLERELGVIKTNQMLWLEFNASTMFDGKRDTIKPSGKILLDKVLKYMALSGSQGVWVSYEFANGRESGQGAQIKTESLVEYLMGKSHLSPGCFNICEPKPLEIPASSIPRLYGQLQRPNQSVVSIRMQRCDI
jgi:hypothetical protein